MSQARTRVRDVTASAPGPTTARGSRPGDLRVRIPRTQRPTPITRRASGFVARVLGS